MVWPSALAETVTPAISSPDGDLIAPVSTTSAAAGGDIQAASEIAIAPATPVKTCAFLIVSLPGAATFRADRAKALRDVLSSLTEFAVAAGRLTHARRAGGP